MNGGAHLLHHADQTKSADMRPAQIENVFRSTRFHELLEHLAAVVMRILDLAVELAVRECAGSTFTELHIGFGIEHGLAPQPERIFSTLTNSLAALENNGAKTHLGEDQPREQPTRSHADHHRPRR